MNPTSSDMAIQSYIEILEKTNQQLSLWSNPYSFITAALSFLVADEGNKM